MDNTPAHSFFETVSKAVIIIPIAIVIIAFVTQTNSPSLLSQSTKHVTPTKGPVVIPTIAVVPPITGTPLDLKGPMTCVAKNAKTTVSADIKNKNIYAKVTKESKTELYLIKGDCIYQWQEKSYEGKKTCGISSYISIAESMAAFKVLTVETLVKMIARMPGASKTTSTQQDYSDLKPICTKGEVNDTVFTIPGAVVFKLAPTPPASSINSMPDY